MKKTGWFGGILTACFLTVFLLAPEPAHAFTVRPGVEFKEDSWSVEHYMTADGLYGYRWYNSSTVGKSIPVIDTYYGTEEVLYLPEEIEGEKVLIVEYLVDTNKTVREVHLPKTMKSFCWVRSQTLERIYVDPQNPYLYAIDGILYFDDDVYGSTLYNYPAGRPEESFTVPSFVSELDGSIFNSAMNALYKTNTVVINDNVKYIGRYAVGGKIPLTIYLNMQDVSTVLQSLGTEASFCNLKKGSRIIVRDEAAKEAVIDKVVNRSAARCEEAEVISLEEHPEYAIASESLTFQDAKTEQNITLAPGEEWSLDGCYIQSPSESTELVTWTSGDPSVVEVSDTAGVWKNKKIMTAKNCGDCDVIGTNDSGRQIVYHVKVYKELELFELRKLTEDGSWGGHTIDQDEELEFAAGEELNVKAFYYPSDSYLCSMGIQADIDTEDPTVAEIVPGDHPNHYRICALKPGVTKGTAVLRDGDKDFTIPFTCEVYEDVENCEIDAIPDQAFAGYGTQICPKPNVHYRGRLLTEGEDYKISYRDNTGFGDYEDYGAVTYRSVIVTGMGNFRGSREIRFKIIDYAEQGKVFMEDCSVDPIPDQIQTFFTQKFCPKVTLRCGSRIFEEGTDYTVRYGNNDTPGVGAYGTTSGGRIYIYFNPDVFRTRENYPKEMMVVYFTIVKAADWKPLTGNPAVSGENPAAENKKPSGTATAGIKKVSLLTVKKSGKKTLSIQWKKVSKASGYEIQVSKNKKFKPAKKVTVKKKSQTKTKVKGLTSKKKYYVRVRAYRTVKGKKVYGKWSGIKSCTVK